MTDQSDNRATPDSNTASSALWQQIDRLCDEFEAVVKSGNHPPVEEWVGRVDESIRQQLRIELQAVIDEYQLEADNSIAASLGILPSAADYGTPVDAEVTLTTTQAANGRVQAWLWELLPRCHRNWLSGERPKPVRHGKGI